MDGGAYKSISQLDEVTKRRNNFHMRTRILIQVLWGEIYISLTKKGVVLLKKNDKARRGWTFSKKKANLKHRKVTLLSGPPL